MTKKWNREKREDARSITMKLFYTRELTNKRIGSKWMPNFTTLPRGDKKVTHVFKLLPSMHETVSDFKG